MPRKAVIQLGTLTQNCLNCICTHMDSLWCKQFIEELFGKGHYRYVVGPFDDLPATLIHQLFMRLKERKLLRKHHLYLLINPFLKTLDYSGENNDLGLLLELVRLRCRVLKTLNLSHCTKLPRKAFQDAFPLFSQNLRSLNLAQCGITDQTLAVIGVYGHQLRELDISSNNIGDVGFLALFTPTDERGNHNDRFGQCQGLRSINTHHTHITEKSAISALEHLPQLTEFHYQNLVSAVYHYLAGSKRTLRLRSLYQQDQEIPQDALQTAIEACPHASVFHICAFRGMDVSSLFAISELDLVTDVSILNEHDIRTTTCDALTPTLMNHSMHLVSLSLADMYDVSLGLILNFCSVLKDLNLLWNNSYVTVPEIQRRLSVPPKLESLTLHCRSLPEDQVADHGATTPPRDELRKLFACKTLKRVFVNNCLFFDDLLLFDVFQHNSFSELQTLEITECHVNLDALGPILYGDNPLERAVFANCHNIYLRDSEAFQKEIKKRKWKLKVFWS